MGSNSPITERVSELYQALQPSFCIKSPAIPSKTTFGYNFFISCIRPAPNKSPDTSPATIPIRTKTYLMIPRSDCFKDSKKINNSG